MKVRNALCLLLIACVFAACGEPVVPRPRGYYRIDLPQASFAPFDSVGTPYAFEASEHSLVMPHKANNAEPFWLDIVYPRFNCKIHVTYRDITTNADVALEDSRRLVYKHTIKADAISESYYDAPERRVFGVLYRIKGDAATPLQFSLTDSTSNMFRGSLYFYCKPNKDSLAPVVNYLEEDIAHIMESFAWKNK